jgi:16S rRNA processing protein RimM
MKDVCGEPVRLGVVIGTHGLQGDLKVRGISPDFPLLLEVAQILVRRPGVVDLSLSVRRTAWHKGNILLRLAGVDHIDAAEPLVGGEILAARSDLPEPAEGTWYWFQVKGLIAFDRRLGELGSLDDVFSTAAHDIYVVHGPYGEVLIPVVPQFVVEVDEAQGRMVFDLPEGLVAEADDL